MCQYIINVPVCKQIDTVEQQTHEAKVYRYEHQSLNPTDSYYPTCITYTDHKRQQVTVSIHNVHQFAFLLLMLLVSTCISCLKKILHLDGCRPACLPDKYFLQHSC